MRETPVVWYELEEEGYYVLVMRRSRELDTTGRSHRRSTALERASAGCETDLN